MKKPNLFNSIAAAAACMITSLLNAALPPAPQWEQEALMSYRVGKHHGLDTYVIAAIQEQLKLRASIPLNIINNEVLSSFQPRRHTEDAIEVTLQGTQPGSIISATRFHTYTDSVVTNPFEIVPEKKVLNAPPIALIVNIYHITDNNDAQAAQNKKLIGSFSISRGELVDVEAIMISLNYSEIRYKNGNRISGINIFPQVHREQ